MKIMQYFYIIMSFAGIFMLGCSIPKYDPHKEYGFHIDNADSKLQNPPENKARIYTYRIGTPFGFITNYYISIFNTDDFDAKKPNWANAQFLAKSHISSAYFTDIDPGHITLYAKTESRHTFSFEAKANTIYCVESSIRIGFFIYNPNFSLVPQERCIKYVSKYLKDNSQERWEKDFERFKKKYLKSK